MAWEQLGTVQAANDWQSVGVSHAELFRVAYSFPEGLPKYAYLKGYLRQCWNPLECDATWLRLYPKDVAETYAIAIPAPLKAVGVLHREIQIRRSFHRYLDFPWIARVDHWVGPDLPATGFVDGGTYSDSTVLDGGIY